MKRICALIALSILFIGCGLEPQKWETVCAEHGTRSVTICKGADGAFVGAFIGSNMAGPWGAAAGAVVGHSASKNKCHQEDEKYCVREKEVLRKAWIEWNERQERKKTAKSTSGNN